MNQNYKNQLENIIFSYTENKNYLQTIIDYTDFLLQKNNELNLISRKLTLEEIINDHIADSISGYPFFKDHCSITDLGSGGGMPGVILAALYPEKNFTLIEKSIKKSNFLNEAIKHLDLKNISVKNSLVEEIKIIDEVITCRAFKDISTILKMTKVFNGVYILYKGKKEKIDEEITAAQNYFKLNFKINKIDFFKEKERHIVILKKN